jgi:hypothetical protein
MTDVSISTQMVTTINYNGSTYSFNDPHEIVDLTKQLSVLQMQLEMNNMNIATLSNVIVATEGITSEIATTNASIAALCTDANKVS